MATKKEAAQDLIDRVRQLRLAGQVGDAEALREEAEAAVKACSSRDRKAMAAALEEAFSAEPEPSKEVAIRPWNEVAGVPELVDKAVHQARDAVEAGLKTADMARQIAETLLQARLRMRNKANLPDIIASSKLTKNIAHDMFIKAREGVTEEDVDRWSTHESLAKAVRNRMSDVVVDFMRSLDDDPDLFPAEAMALARAAHPDKSPMEAVYALYQDHGFSIPRKGRTEIAREQARLKARRLKELEASGQASEDEEDLAADIQVLERMERSFDRLTSRAQKLPDDERGALKAKINEVITTLAAKAASL